MIWSKNHNIALVVDIFAAFVIVVKCAPAVMTMYEPLIMSEFINRI